MNRNYIGFDISQEYIEICNERLSETSCGEKVNVFIGRPKYANQSEQDLLFLENQKTQNTPTNKKSKSIKKT